MARMSVLTAVFLVALALAVAAWPRDPGGLRGWLAEVRDGDDDWGWDFISTYAQTAYQGGAAAYAEDMAAVDWEALELGTPVEVWSDDGVALLQAELLSDPSTVPAFLVERGIVKGVCEDGEPTGIWVIEDRGLLQEQRFGTGGTTGTQRRCDATFADAKK